MDFTHFIFAFYVFLLVCAAVWFHGRVMRADQKKDRSSYEKEHRLFTMYQNVEDMLDSFETYAEEAKSGIDARLGQVESLIESLRKEWEKLAEERAKQIEMAAKPAPNAKQEESEAKPETKAIPAEIAKEPAPAESPAESEAEPVQMVLPVESPPAPVAKAPQPDSIKPALKNEAYVKRPQRDSKDTDDKPKLKTPDLIQKYIEEGMSKEEIAKTLGISMREVTLIMEIKKIHV